MLRAVDEWDELSDEEQAVAIYRFEVFHGELGFPETWAEELAFSDADLHLARKIMKGGCDHITAYRILL